MAQAAEHIHDGTINGTPASEIPPFLGLNQQQSALLVALYNETDPEFAKQMPTALPVAAEKLAAEYEKRNSVAKKLERANSRFLEEYQLIEQVQQEAVERLSKTDMNVDKAAEGLCVDENGSVHDLMLASFLYGGVRAEAKDANDRASMSPVASPNFEGAKKLMADAFAKGNSMAAVQIGSFYAQEDKLANGANMKNKADPKQEAFAWFSKAAEQLNPMACHKVAFYRERGYGCKQDLKEAVEYYRKAFDQGYPDSAHNLGLIYQGNTPETASFKDIQESIHCLERAKQWGYAPSGNALGRLFLLMSKDEALANAAGNPGSDKEDYIVTGIDSMEWAANNGDADAMLMLGLIFGSRDYGLYDMEKAQNYMELALIRGDLEAYTYLVRILRAKMAARVALEKENMENFEKLSPEDKAKLIQQLAKEAAPENVLHHQCANPTCDKKEETPGEFKRCGQCERVAYCSRECQKQHWKAGHKIVCAALANSGAVVKS